MRKTKFLLAVLAFAALLSGCTMWEDEHTDIIPLPQVETPIAPEPWEPPKTDSNHALK